MRGKLKIFYSYIAGAGKTYAMLQAAHQLKAEGKDVVIGYVEPHTRPDTMALVEGLELIAPKTVNYKNLDLKDLDLEAVLARKPEYVVIDELAHTNAPGLRHTKRYQDVLDCLDAGINVLTTVNIQHLVSLQDVVKQISKIEVTETLPDYIFDEADQVALVDIEPVELHERLQAGKIYPTAKVNRAVENFFSQKKLTALREVALRRGAARLVATNRKNQMDAGDTVLACLSYQDGNGRVIRSAARLAKALKADFHAIYVQTDKDDELDQAAKDQLNTNFKLAKSLGAQISHIHGADAAVQIVDYAEMVRATKIVMGRSGSHRWRLKASTSDRIIAALPEVEVHIIPDVAPTGHQRSAKLWEQIKAHFHLPIALASVAIVLAAIGLGLVLDLLGAPVLVVIGVIEFAVLLVAYKAPSSWYPAGSVILAILLYNFLFVEPYYTFAIAGHENLINYLLMGVITLFFSTFVAQIRRTQRAATQSSNKMAAILNANRKFSLATNEDEVLHALSEVINEIQPGDWQIMKKDEVATWEGISEKERGIIEWSLTNLHSAGYDTDTLKDVSITCYPIRTADYVAGAVVIREGQLDEAQKRALKAVLAEAAAFIQRVKLVQAQREQDNLAERERLKMVFMRGVSHDMRTPLAVIEGAAETLLQTWPSPDEDAGVPASEQPGASSLALTTTAAQKQLLADIRNESHEMARSIDNLLNMTKVTSQAFELQLQPEVLEEIVENAIEKCQPRKKGRHISLVNPEKSTIINCDPNLVSQVVINLLDNAIKHTTDDGEIKVKIKESKEWVQLKVIDNGTGIQPEVLPHIFNDFLTSDSQFADRHRGLGLGLGICKSVVESHGGHMYARNHENGAEVGFAMPKSGQAGSNQEVEPFTGAIPTVA
ncbi:hypothetical protein BK816_07420 [Boudabousia tangfeifanii]|uniref:histidine kinase n=1 Tax=Boudabousia tangfeifanii TaxID=1912795 RepID=A0A1D9MLW9_9ACTO|nr:ATP-binding protein [Boudabousia tangfeifanii]AOZ73140.1 hypothetical protein BK816_07420 [Boudabousia tangfeifanii]